MRRDDTVTTRTFIVCLLVIVGFLIWAFIDNFFKDPLEFDSQGISETVSINGLAFIPGESRDYSFKLKCRDAGEYQVGLKLLEKADGCLKNFIDVNVVLDGNQVLSGNLGELMGTAEIVLRNYSFGRESVDLVITYSMPDTIGNEAMGASADFDMKLLISEKGDVLDE